MRSSRLVAALLVAAAPTTSLAQSEPVATRPTSPPVPVTDSADVVVTQQGQPRQPNCWRAQRPCRTYFLTDIGVEFPVWYTRHPDSASAGGRARDFQIRPVWTVGLMGTRGGRHAHGAAISIVGENTAGPLPLMLEYRYRNWLGPSAAADAGIGYKRNGFYEPPLGLVEGKGVTMMLAFTPNRWIGISARGDIMRAAGRDRLALLFGVQSTRVSEEAFRLVLVTMVRELLAKIGIETDDEEDQ